MMKKVFMSAHSDSNRIRVDAERDTQVFNALVILCKIFVRLVLTIKLK